MSRRTLVLGVVLACIGLPALAVIAAAASHYVANRATGTIVSSGKERPYIVHLPPGYDPAKPTPLVISLHGALGWPSIQMKVTGWNRVADEHGFIAVYPAGQGGATRVWYQQGASNPSRMPDVVFISELIDKLAATYNIDPARIYANGFSNGGGMSFALSCTLSHRIAAIGAVGAANTLPWAWCSDRTPVPMIAFHGTGKREVPYHGGKALIWKGGEFPSIPEWTAKWARRNGCGATPADSRVRPDVMRREYSGCAKDATVVLYTIEDGGHTWPGGAEEVSEWLLGRHSRSIDASETMWAFFREHPLRR
ncbi:MAG: PHB depolymerase family esterase [Usitatibacter sp.]